MSCPSLASSPYHSSLLAGLQGYIPYPYIAAVCMYVRAGRPAFAWPYVGVHRSTSLMSSSLLLQQCPACLVRLTCIVFVIGGKWPYSWCLVWCCQKNYIYTSCHAISTDIHDILSPHLPIIHCFRQILMATSRIGTELLYVGSNWTSSL